MYYKNKREWFKKTARTYCMLHRSMIKTGKKTYLVAAREQLERMDNYVDEDQTKTIEFTGWEDEKMAA